MSKLSTVNLFYLINNPYALAIRDPYCELAAKLGRMWGHSITLPCGRNIWGYL